jgi:steroid delta-isomerase-like uncharacterized protein
MATEENVRRMQELAEAFNRHDLDAIMRGYGDDAVFTDYALQQTLKGQAEIREYWRQVLAASSDQRFDVTAMIGAGEWTVVRGVNAGTADGQWAGIEPTNRPYELSTCFVLRLEDGKIAEAHVYYDLYGLLVQMGLAPALTQTD